MNHLELLEQLTYHWDGVMTDIDDLVTQAKTHEFAGAAVYLKLAGELKRCATAAENDIAKLVAPLAKAAAERYVPAVGTVDIRPGSTRHKYDNTRLVGIIASRAAEHYAVDRETGEILPASIVAQHACRAVAEAAGATTDSFSGWRKATVEKLGVNLAEHRTSEYGAPRAVIIP